MILEGKVLDVHTGYPVDGAEINCAGPDGLLRGFSDNGGYFKFLLLNSGRLQVFVQKPPYCEGNCRCAPANSDLYINIYLEMEGLEEEVVTA